MRFLLLLALIPFTAQAKVSVEFAYRPAALEESSIIGLQGKRSSHRTFVKACGEMAANCECHFYKEGMNPVRSTSIGISRDNNSISCVMPEWFALPGEVFDVAVHRLDGKRISKRIPVRTTLQLSDVLGSMKKEKVRGIFRYSCNKTFLEGEGVDSRQISCVPGQRLGVLNATYNFYTYRSAEDANSPGGDSAFAGDICHRNNFLRIQCSGNTPELRYGLMREAAGPFNVALTMTRAPEGDRLTERYGYAALPDTAGHCPAGLVKARPFVAQPQSITQGSLDGTNPPSSFINTGNSLNNTVVERYQPQNFVVVRQPNLTTCDVTGDCSNATFDGQQQAQSVSYTALTPVVCVIPPELMSGLF